MEAEIEVFERLTQEMMTEIPQGKRFALHGPRAMRVLVTLNQGQGASALAVSKWKVSVVSGKAGVGKTYMMRAICEIADENGLNVLLCAPTGKAARKLSHATGRTAMTIHRLLVPKFDENTGAFSFCHNEQNKLLCDFVIVDEVSMVDVQLMRALLAAMPSHARMLLVGDHHQIPSVGPGAILRDILSASHLRAAADDVPSVMVLDKIVRQAGVLARNTTAVLDGVVVDAIGSSWAWQKVAHGDDETALAEIATLVEAVVTAPLSAPLQPFGRALDLAFDVQVLAPMRKGKLGTYAINTVIQQLRQRLLGNHPPPVVEQDRSPAPLVGDRVIWTKNDYKLELFNGTQAIVMALPKDGSMELLTEDGRDVSVPPGKRKSVEVAYAMTIHKAQGSEWPLVIVAISGSHYIMRDRNLLYTAAGRASESLTIVGDARSVSAFAKEQKSLSRQTFGAFYVNGWRPTNAIASK